MSRSYLTFLKRRLCDLAGIHPCEYWDFLTENPDLATVICQLAELDLYAKIEEVWGIARGLIPIPPELVIPKNYTYKNPAQGWPLRFTGGLCRPERPTQD